MYGCCGGGSCNAYVCNVQGRPTEAVKELDVTDYQGMQAKDYLPGAEALEVTKDEVQPAPDQTGIIVDISGISPVMM